ncbi:hypothetical protein A8990_109154 [Paenibacillus taihuensis]|uniref:Tetratricopeptide repeat protein n=1 Tax=Paenibacillus taihuensis TaxID=1156355 RepID=A0A3D9S3Z7_9BACL|nr:hypothetical protein [Paenibacillus taihuensis]REE87508.1 hypothetical protein A8990_109154 [Paenibacillus taihuensis]
MIEIYAGEFRTVSEALSEKLLNGELAADSSYFQAVLPILQLLGETCPERPEFSAWYAEFLHLDGNLRRAGEAYRRLLQAVPPEAPSDHEISLMRKFCPLLLTNPLEYFPLKDVAVVHHPVKPLIGYHLFWEDDYDFPDDYEPCDHEEIWVEYDPQTETVTRVLSFFHSRVIASEAAIAEAHENGGRPIIRVEWGKHGSLLKGWEEMCIPLTDQSIMEWMKTAYESMRAGGRLPGHPLKRHWPNRFDRNFEDYIDFSVPVDPLNFLHMKPLFFKSLCVNAVLYTEGLPYNFHPKMEWPERFGAAVRGSLV